MLKNTASIKMNGYFNRMVLSFIIVGMIANMLFVSGCAGSYVKLNPIMRIPENIDSYQIGHIQTTFVGEPMLSRIKGSYSPGYVVTQDFQPLFASLRGELIQKGSKWGIIGTLDDGTLVCGNPDYPKPFENVSRASWDYCLAVDKNDVAFGYVRCFLNSDADEERRANERIKFDRWVWNKPTKFLNKIDKVYHSGTLHQDIVYSGKSGNTLKLTYREFNDDPTHITYSNELIYDLMESKIIVIRGMQIEILEATNSEIKYLIKSPMN